MIVYSTRSQDWENSIHAHTAHGLGKPLSVCALNRKLPMLVRADIYCFLISNLSGILKDQLAVYNFFIESQLRECGGPGSVKHAHYYEVSPMRPSAEGYGSIDSSFYSSNRDRNAAQRASEFYMHLNKMSVDSIWHSVSDEDYMGCIGDAGLWRRHSPLILQRIEDYLLGRQQCRSKSFEEDMLRQETKLDMLKRPTYFEGMSFEKGLPLVLY